MKEVKQGSIIIGLLEFSLMFAPAVPASAHFAEYFHMSYKKLGL